MAQPDLNIEFYWFLIGESIENCIRTTRNNISLRDMRRFLKTRIINDRHSIDIIILYEKASRRFPYEYSYATFYRFFRRLE